jgi:hypothetical protein
VGGGQKEVDRDSESDEVVVRAGGFVVRAISGDLQTSGDQGRVLRHDDGVSWGVEVAMYQLEAVAVISASSCATHNRRFGSIMKAR